MINASIIALLSGLLGTLWFTTALVKVNFISFSVVFLLQKLQPLFATSAGVLLLKEKINKQYLLWAALAIVAAYFVTFKNGYVSFATGEGQLLRHFMPLEQQQLGEAPLPFPNYYSKSTLLLQLLTPFLHDYYFCLCGWSYMVGSQTLGAVDGSQLVRFYHNCAIHRHGRTLFIL
jgi:hypothetical protein